MNEKSVLFVCLGNICRSPIAESVFRDTLQRKGVLGDWVIDSAATGPWHVGKRPDRRAVGVLDAKGLDSSHKARVLTRDDFNKFYYIFGMDENNIEDIKEMAPSGYKGKIELLGDYDPKGKKIIRDPYYDSGDKGFHECLDHCERALDAFAKKIGL